jgi:hypothetical protein
VRHGLLALAHVAALDVGGEDEGAGIAAVEFLDARLDACDLASLGAIAAIDENAIIIDNNWMDKAIFLDVLGEVGNFVIRHHRK